MNIQEINSALGRELFPHQLEVLVGEEHTPLEELRALILFPTGAGKTTTALALLAYKGVTEACVAAPKATHDAWQETASLLGIELDVITVQKFYQKDYKLKQGRAFIVDEAHMLGSHDGKAFKKLDRNAPHLKAPLILMSATPEYNDAERVYCIQHILDPLSCPGGYLKFLKNHFVTESTLYSMVPVAVEFLRYSGDDAARQYLADLPHVYYQEDTVTFTIQEQDFPMNANLDLLGYGIDYRNRRVIASQIEERHALRVQAIVDTDERLHPHLYDHLTYLAGQAHTPLLVYAWHEDVVQALANSLVDHGVEFATYTGSTPDDLRAAAVASFKAGELDVLIGTDALATGTDGLDKVCDWLILLDDTNDDTRRRQLIGRILPRGADKDATKKVIVRFNYI